MARIPIELLSFGVLLLIASLCLAIWASGLIGLTEVPPLTIALFGVWVMALAGMRSSATGSHKRSAFSYFAWGILISAFGTIWFLSSRQILLGYLPAILLFVIGILIVIGALRYRER